MPHVISPIPIVIAVDEAALVSLFSDLKAAHEAFHYQVEQAEAWEKLAPEFPIDLSGRDAIPSAWLKRALTWEQIQEYNEQVVAWLAGMEDLKGKVQRAKERLLEAEADVKAVLPPGVPVLAGGIRVLYYRGSPLYIDYY